MALRGNEPERSLLGRTLIAVGISGAALVAVCCFAPFIVAGLLTAIGLGFILKDSSLIGLLVLFLGLATVGYYVLRRHRLSLAWKAG